MEQPNISYIQSMSGGDKNFEKKLLDIIKLEFPTEIQAYYNSMRIKNFNDASEIVHKIKHKISILGLEENYRDAKAFEHGLRKGDVALQSNFETTLMIITDYLKNFE